MRIAFAGKGGSGKTTMSALFARHLAAARAPVVAIDADINQHLGEALGMEADDVRAMPAMGDHLDKIKEYLRGGNPRISSAAAMVKTTPPGRGSRTLRLLGTDEIHGLLTREAGGVRLMVTGTFSEDDLGVSCYHRKTGAVELYLNHLVDGAGEYVVVDMTAGADCFASGLFTRFDLTVLVAEPTSKGVSVYRQYRDHASGHGVRLAVVGNKVQTQGDVDYLRAEVGADLLGWAGNSTWVRAGEQGAPRPLADLEEPTVELLSLLRRELDARVKDWDHFHAQAVEFHLRNAGAWGNAATGVDLAEQIDPGYVPGRVSGP
jgi:CO dehydrogenase maturation factor